MPALNEAATIEHVIRSIREDLGADVLVVDDGSSDETASIATSAGAMVVSHPFNLGVGAAIRSGLRVAASRGYDAAIQIDADGQHDPAAARGLLAPVLADEADVVVGSRFGVGSETYRVGAARRAAMRLLSRLVSRHVGVALTDTTSGFRAFSRRAVAAFARAYPTAYLSDTVEALLLGADAGLRVAEVPVSMRPRMGGVPSAGGAVSALHLLRVFLVILLHDVRRPLRPRTWSPPVVTRP